LAKKNKEGAMRRNFKIGLILGIALLMLVPVYASAQMNLSNPQNCSGGGTVATITATQGDTISFIVTSSLPNLQLIAPESGMALTNGTFTWNTAGFLGPYVALFESSNGTQAQQLVVMIMINAPSSGGSPPSNPTLTVNINPSGAGSVTSITPSGPYTAGTDVTITVSPSANYTFSSWSSNVTSSSGTTAHVTMPSSNITVTATFTATGGGGGGTGSKTNPILLNQTSSVINGGNWGYTLNSTGTTSVATGTRTYFEFIPSWACGTTKYFWIYVLSSGNIQIYFSRVDSNGNFLSGVPGTGTDESSLGGKVAQFAVQALRYSGGLEQYKWLIGIDNQTGVSVPIYIWIAPVCQ
jgi:hypothetical protein